MTSHHHSQTPATSSRNNSNNTRMNDEYTDYSCSTSIERLARDVETLLRSWHVDNGNDRHISMIVNNTANTNTTNGSGGDGGGTTTSGNGYGRSYSGASSIATSNSCSQLSTGSSTTTMISTTTPGRSSNTRKTTLLLRSDIITWNVTLPASTTKNAHNNHRHLSSTSGIVSFTIDLKLALWDGPGTATTTNNNDDDDDDDEEESGLPHSLRRDKDNNFITTMRGPMLFENMSNLFGIGQHITLTPVLPRQPQQQQQHQQSCNASRTGSAVDSSITDLLQFLLTQTILQRHESTETRMMAQYSLYQVLSGWLQTALNCAIDNCHCCIPVFGFWGSYYPEEYRNNYTSQTTRIKSRKQQQQQQSQKHYFSSSRGGISDGGGELQLLPTWMQDVILDTDLPTGLPHSRNMSRKQYNESKAIQNHQYFSPVVTGTVLPTNNTVKSILSSSSSSKHHSFLCSIIPSTSEVPLPCRLTLWGSILLQHCPNDGDEDNNTVVMNCARHVFAWWKQPLQKASTIQLLFQPDNYHLENVNNPYTAWRRRPTKALQQPPSDTAATTKTTRNGDDGNESYAQPSESIIRNADSSTAGKINGHHQIIDLTGEEENDLRDNSTCMMKTYYLQREKYQNQCLTMALSLLDEASGATASEPRWGPIDDPVASIHATVRWNGSPNNPPQISGSTNATDPAITRQPLLSFPLRIRSKHSMSKEDWVEMEESIERTILDPMLPSSTFHLQTWWDMETSVASLAATQQCVLASLIRTATLPDETLLKHITDDDVVEQWDNAAGNVVASCLAQQAQVGPTTRALVDVMDWVTASEDKMELHKAEVLVRHILQPDNGSNFPQPPKSPLEESASISKGFNTSSIPSSSFVGASSSISNVEGRPATNFQEGVGAAPDNSGAVPSMGSFAPLFKSAPIGRLVSILCVHMARLRSPCSMAMLWMAFVHEVRMRWEHRLVLPHMNYVPGLDPSPLDMKGRNKSLNTLGVKADLAAYWHGPVQSNINNITASSGSSSCASMERGMEFPDDHHCLIGQKLQVVNLCIDLVTAVEARRQQKQLEQSQQPDKRRRLDNMDVDRDYESNRKSMDDLKKKIQEANRTLASNGSTNDDEDFGDPSESERFEDALSEADFFDSHEAAEVAEAAQRSMEEYQQTRKQQDCRGARCPVPDSRLVETGVQLYAPFLQRPYPLTDDVIAERYTMLSKHGDAPGTRQHGIHRRLEISYRLQKPKLLSDMCAFKAANPGSIFQDFINWYGNPQNPIEDYVDNRSSSSTHRHGVGGATIGDLVLGRVSSQSAAVKLDKATEAIQILNETREFWSRTWEEATPIPASEQKLLFDVTSTVEMALDFMENMHPAILLNQCMAVNLAVSYFTLIGAAKETGVDKIGGLVERSFLRLRETTEKALELLSGDATKSTSSACNAARRHEGSSSFVSTEAITACDAACSALSDAEVVNARATSLLHKFPDQYQLVESILRHEPGHEISLSDDQIRSQILQVIQKQQHEKLSQKKTSPTKSSGANACARPALREYVLRNIDDSCPCQLSVRFAEEQVMFGKKNSGNSEALNRHAPRGGMIIALTKTVTD